MHFSFSFSASSNNPNNEFHYSYGRGIGQRRRIPGIFDYISNMSFSNMWNMVDMSFADIFNRYSEIQRNQNQPNTAEKERQKKKLEEYLRSINLVKTHGGECPICLTTFEENEMGRKFFCKHIFHKDCVDPWIMKLHEECPVCRKNFFTGK